jgi:membrane glycosyltransferase
MISSILDAVVQRAYAANPINFLDLPQRQINNTPLVGLVDFINRIIEILLSLAYPLAFAAIVYSSFILITSNGNPDAFTKVKKNLTYLVTGLFLIVFSVVAIRFISSLFGL